MAEQSMKEESAEEVVSDEEAYLFAMELAGASAVPMVLKSAIELGILETIAKAGPGAHLSPSEIAAQIPNIKNPNAPAMLDRMFRLLVSYNILKLRFPHGNMSERHYALHPKAKYLVNNQDAVSVSAYFLMGHDKVLTEMWYKLTESVEEGGFPFNNAYGMNAFEFHDANPRFNRLFNKGLSDCSSIAMKKILEIYKGFEGVGSLVDVGGGTGAIIGMIASKYSSIKCLNFDLPHVIKEAPSYAGSFHFLPPGNWCGTCGWRHVCECSKS